MDFLKALFCTERGVSDETIQRFFLMYDCHFAAMYSMDHAIIDTLGIETQDDIDDILIPKLVKMGIYPVNEHNEPIYDKDTFTVYCDTPMKSSTFFAVERLRICLDNLNSVKEN